MGIQTWNQRLGIALKARGKKQADLVRVARVTPASVSGWLGGGTTMMEGQYAAIVCDYLKIRELWLFHNRLPSGLEDVSNVEPGPDIRGMAPLISSVRAGTWGEANDPFRPGEAEDWLPMPKKGGPNTYCLRVDGDSMTAPYGKSYPNGSIIFVDPDLRSPASGQRIVAKLRGQPAVTFKVFVHEAGKIWLRPLNPQHPPITEEFSVLGTIIGKWEEE